MSAPAGTTAPPVRPGDLFRVVQAHYRHDDFMVLNKGVTALIVACKEDGPVFEAIVADPSGEGRRILLSVSQIVDLNFWEWCDAEVR